MAWRLYDMVNSEWYNDTLYETREACTKVAHAYMEEAHAMDEVLELLAEPCEPSELMENFTTEDER